MATLYTLKIRGLTSASATIATQDVTYDSDGYLRFTVGGIPHTLQVNGELAYLLNTIFTGTGGIDAGSTGVQGHRPFGIGQLQQ